MKYKKSLICGQNRSKTALGFTIVELLVVIIIIGILASITMVVYTGITLKATAATLQSDLKNASTILEMDKTIAGTYPATKEAANSGNGLNPSPGTDLTYTYISNTDNYTLVAGKGETSYFITSPGKTPTIGTILDATLIVDIEIAIGQIADDKAANGTYPATKEIANDGGGLHPSPGVDFTYIFDAPTDTYTLIASKDGKSYSITSEDTRPVAPSSTSFVVAWGKTDEEEGYSVVQTSDGGYAITGEIYGFGAGGYDMFLAKYDSIGNLSWNKTWGGTGAEEGRSIINTSDGGYAIAGTTSSFGAINGDVFLAKYNSSGDLSWSKTWGTSSIECIGDLGPLGGGKSLVQTNDNGYALTGTTYVNGATNSDMFLVRYDESGNLLWNKTWGGPLRESGYSIVLTSDNGYAVTGSTYSFGAGNRDVFITKFDSAGNLSWNKTWGGTNFEEGYSIILDSNGDYVITGTTRSFGTWGDDLLLLKYDASGNLIFNKTWGSDVGYEEGYSVVQSSDGGYVISGMTNSHTDGGYADMLLVKFDNSGDISWNKIWGWDDTGDDRGGSIINTSDGGYAVTGVTYWPGDGSPNYTDMFLAKFDSNGIISKCSILMCQNLSTAIQTTPTANISNPSATVTSPTASISSPTATVTTPTATTTVIVAP